MKNYKRYVQVSLDYHDGLQLLAEESTELANDTWVGTTLDLTLLALGMVYRTEAECKAHLAEDYKKLTGKELEQ